MSLYNNFSSKADLINAYIEARHAEWQGLYQERLKAATTPRERVLAVFDRMSIMPPSRMREGFAAAGFERRR